MMEQVYNISSFTNLNNEESVNDISAVAVSKGQQIYNQLYTAALLSMIKDNFPLYDSIEEFKDAYIIIDTPQLDFNIPPTSVSIREKNDITHSINIDLSKYWPSYKYLNGGSNDIIMINKKDIVANYELISVDYVRNIAIMKNKESGITYNIPLNKIDNNSPISSDLFRNTFTDIINNG